MKEKDHLFMFGSITMMSGVIGFILSAIINTYFNAVFKSISFLAKTPAIDNANVIGYLAIGIFFITIVLGIILIYYSTTKKE